MDGRQTNPGITQTDNINLPTKYPYRKTMTYDPLKSDKKSTPTNLPFRPGGKYMLSTWCTGVISRFSRNSNNWDFLRECHAGRDDMKAGWPERIIMMHTIICNDKSYDQEKL